MTLCEFLAEHPNLRVSIWYSNNYYYVDVFSNVFHNGILPFRHFSFPKSLLEIAVSSFDTIIGTHLENWYHSLTNNDIERIDGKSVKEIPYTVSIADEVLTFKDQEGGDAQ